MVIVMFVAFIESTGMFLALGDMTGYRSARRTSRAACASTASARSSAACFNSFPIPRSRRTSA